MVYGHIARAHGIRGELRVVPLDPTVPFPSEVHTVRISPKHGETRTFRVAQLRPVHRALLLTLEGVSDRTTAESLRSSVLELCADELAPAEEGETYLYEFIGARVVDESGHALGRVQRIVGEGDHVLLELASDDQERLLPLAAPFIVSFDPSEQLLTVRPPAGLWDEP